jgi:serine/threonine protein kinase
MDHPHIARVFDGGVTERGRPFFVMEYIKGVPLTEYCDKAQLSLRERLQLFIPVCQAVQHAHVKGIVHRDLKPSNILVCLYDGRAVPKVIDFGLARALHHELTDLTLHTAHGQMVGTPVYMSPEQAEFNNLDIDTRSDIYSLGVVLYELLTWPDSAGQASSAEGSLGRNAAVDSRRMPVAPSTRLSGSERLPGWQLSVAWTPDSSSAPSAESSTGSSCEHSKRNVRGDTKPAAVWLATSSDIWRMKLWKPVPQSTLPLSQIFPSSSPSGARRMHTDSQEYSLRWRALPGAGSRHDWQKPA